MSGNFSIPFAAITLGVYEFVLSTLGVQLYYGRH
jgi:hypothetical protein